MSNNKPTPPRTTATEEGFSYRGILVFILLAFIFANTTITIVKPKPPEVMIQLDDPTNMVATPSELCTQKPDGMDCKTTKERK